MFIIGIFLASVLSLAYVRGHALGSTFIERGDYPGMRGGPLRRAWEITRSVIEALRPVVHRYHAFISYKDDPNRPEAADFARALQARGLEVTIFEEPLNPEPFVQDAGPDVGFRRYTQNRMVQSATVVIVASRPTFTSMWVLEEFSLAMREADLVLLAIVDDTPPQLMIPRSSAAFAVTLTAPVYALDAGPYYPDAPDRLAKVLRTFAVGRRKLGNDISAALGAALFTLAVAAVVASSGRTVDLARYPGLMLYYASALVAAVFAPCRTPPPSGLLREEGYQPLLRGWNTDYGRLNGLFFFPLMIPLWSIPSFAVRLACVMAFFVFWSLIPAIHDGIQLRAILPAARRYNRKTID
jgi:hypothetical protein